MSASERLDLPNQLVAIRRISSDESTTLADTTRKRNVFARHSYENSFYLERIGQLDGATVIELFEPGALKDILPKVRRKAELVERLAFASSTLGLRRKRTHQLLAISPHRRYGFDLAISPGFEYLRSSSRRDATPKGVPVTSAFRRRFLRCGFPALLECLAGEGDFSRRLVQALSWLFESRLEPSGSAAAVKTAIALESLLIANDSESLRGPLAERAAFVLSDGGAERRRLAKAVRGFYDLRSAIVHGGRRRSAVAPLEALEGMDRLVLLLMLTMAANTSSWGTFSTAVDAIEDRKWGMATAPILRPFPGSHLTRAIQLLETPAGRSTN